MADNERPQAKLTTFVTGFPEMEENEVIESETPSAVAEDVPIYRTRWDDRLKKKVKEWSSVSTYDQTEDMSQDFAVTSQSHPSKSDQPRYIFERERAPDDDPEARHPLALADLPQPSSPPGEEAVDVKRGTEAKRKTGVHLTTQTPELSPGNLKPLEHVVVPVKGILRTPKEKFPEDPSPFREGVAPLKDAKRNGLPPDARWTKISRELVNPEALELGKERFEAREKFVIVLRVLTREEVQGYAQVTSSIRAKREELEEIDALERRRKRRASHEEQKLERKRGEKVRIYHQERGADPSTESEDGDRVTARHKMLEEVQGYTEHTEPVQKTPEEAEGKEERKLEYIRNLQSSDLNQDVEDVEESEQVQEDNDDGLPIDVSVSSSRGKRENLEEEDDSRSDRSGASSLASVTASIFSIVSGSSMSSIAGPQNAVEKLVSLLLDDEVIKSLCKDALSDIERERFERNLRRLLKEFAVDLRKEADSEPERHAAHFVRLRARNSAYIICSTLSKKNIEKLETLETELLSEGSDSDRSDDEVDDLVQLENFIRCSKAIIILRDNLRAFVHPVNITTKFKLEDRPQNTIPRISMDENLGTISHGHANNIFSKAQEMEDDHPLARKELPRAGYREESYIEKSTDSRVPKLEVEHNTDEPVRCADNTEEEYGDDGYGYTNASELLRYDLDDTWSGFTDDLRLTISSHPHLHSRARSSSPHGQLSSNRADGKRTPINARLPHLKLQRLRDRKTRSHSFSGNNSKDVEGISNADGIKHSTIQAEDILAHSGDKAQDAEVTEIELSQSERRRNSAIESTATSIYPNSLMIGIMDSLKWTPNSVPKGKSRINLKCKCGHTITDDYDTQLSNPQALERIKQKLDHSNSTSTSSPRMNSLSQVFSSGLQSIRSAIATSKTEMKPSLPTYEMQLSPIPAQNQPSSPTPLQVDPMYLLVCYNEGRHVTKLFQLDLHNILQAETDKALFQKLHQSYHTLRSRWFSWMSLRVLESINFVHFEMYKSELVDIRKQNDLPSPSDTSYRYNPAPPELVPPIGSHYLVHVLEHPECAEDEPICLSRFPKKLKEKLACMGATGMKPGWGLQITESWDAKKIWLIGFVFFGLGSLAIGILWAVLKHSVQDAFAIAAYMVAFATISIGTIQALLEM